MPREVKLSQGYGAGVWWRQVSSPGSPSPGPTSLSAVHCSSSIFISLCLRKIINTVWLLVGRPGTTAPTYCWNSDKTRICFKRRRTCKNFKELVLYSPDEERPEAARAKITAPYAVVVSYWLTWSWDPSSQCQFHVNSISLNAYLCRFDGSQVF